MTKSRATDIIFYDGGCGLCHFFVRFVLLRDGHEVFRFAPLDSDAFRTRVPQSHRGVPPETVVVLSDTGAILTRSDGVLYVLRRLGGLWRCVAAFLKIFPRALRNWVYDQAARIRHRLFRVPAEACPVVPERLRQRFEI